MIVVGDAAHAPSPTSGQGASLSIEDGVVLAKCLRDLPSTDAAFARFEALRRPRVERIIKAAARINNSKAAGPVARVFRDAMMPLFLRMAARSGLGRDVRLPHRLGRPHPGAGLIRPTRATSSSDPERNLDSGRARVAGARPDPRRRVDGVALAGHRPRSRAATGPRARDLPGGARAGGVARLRRRGERRRLLRRAPGPRGMHCRGALLRRLGGRRRDPLPERGAGARSRCGDRRGDALLSRPTARCPSAPVWWSSR